MSRAESTLIGFVKLQLKFYDGGILILRLAANWEQQRALLGGVGEPWSLYLPSAGWDGETGSDVALHPASPVHVYFSKYYDPSSGNNKC